ncbi:MAG: hypothetical protein QXV17_06855 [Candidatus Micrarchaeaceae archaeon]
MVSKTRRVTGTTYPRYEEKAYAVHRGMSPSDELARRTAAAQLAQWQAGFGSLHEAWLKVTESNVLDGVPKMMYGLYHSAVVHFMSKVIRYGKMSVTEWLDYWSNPDKGLDGGVLSRIADLLGGERYAGGTG